MGLVWFVEHNGRKTALSFNQRLRSKSQSSMRNAPPEQTRQSKGPSNALGRWQEASAAGTKEKSSRTQPPAQKRKDQAMDPTRDGTISRQRQRDTGLSVGHRRLGKKKTPLKHQRRFLRLPSQHSPEMRMECRAEDAPVL